MHRIRLPVCSQCRHPALAGRTGASRAVSAGSTPGARRFRSTHAAPSRRSRPQRTLHAPNPNRLWLPAHKLRSPQQESKHSPSVPVDGDLNFKFTKITPSTLESFFKTYINRWTKIPQVHKRLQSFGIPAEDIPVLFSAYNSAIQAGELSSTPELQEKYLLSRFLHISPPQYYTQLDIIYSNIFFQWASDPLHEPHLINQVGVPRSTIESIQRLAQATERMYPEEEFPSARKMKRKIIMHVGPTNSGKTHHALRALAASKSGVYAGPLRLLAHEIWERLNLGQIVPLGAEEKEIVGQKRVEGGPNVVSIPDPVPSKEDEKALDVPGVSTAAKRQGNPKYARRCNMVTGEEQKIVQEDAPLLSCTVEMLSLGKRFDVAVIDEIQMIADEHRGGAWTNAVLGICAEELHLCGEETAVPIVEAILKDTGDELIVNRYNRLTPLVVEEKSLEGDLSNVQPGDCIVTFSRSNIFGLKKQVEEKTGMRCAVVYGKLPPEIRSEQAALFNDPDSGYDVIIGSDAIGMGLNLKIRRVIFEAMSKWNGSSEQPLSISQVKQIAGRAGRYGLHSSSSAGYTTTLQPSDLSFLHSTLDTPVSPLMHARLSYNATTANRVTSALPPGASMTTIHHAHLYASRLQAHFQYAEPAHLDRLCGSIDAWMAGPAMAGMSLKDRMLLLNSPVAWRDEVSVGVVRRFVEMYQEEVYVDLRRALEGSGMMEVLEEAEGRMEAEREGAFEERERELVESLRQTRELVQAFGLEEGEVTGYSNNKARKGRLEKTIGQLERQLRGLRRQWRQTRMEMKDLLLLENFHKTIVVYVWMGFRNPVAYSDYEYAAELKGRVEHALEWCLERLDSSSQAERERADESEREDVRLQARERFERNWSQVMSRIREHMNTPQVSWEARLAQRRETSPEGPVRSRAEARRAIMQKFKKPAFNRPFDDEEPSLPRALPQARGRSNDASAKIGISADTYPSAQDTMRSKINVNPSGIEYISARDLRLVRQQSQQGYVVRTLAKWKAFQAAGRGGGQGVQRGRRQGEGEERKAGARAAASGSA